MPTDTQNDIKERANLLEEMDCYVRELHMGFECDGKRYHAGVAKGKKDRSRDDWIWDNAQIPIVRIQADAIQWRLWEDLKTRITAEIDRHAGDIEKRRRSALVEV